VAAVVAAVASVLLQGCGLVIGALVGLLAGALADPEPAPTTDNRM
jgi:hypothetical protein